MLSAMTLPYILAFCRVVIALVFWLSGASKVLDVAQFRQTIGNFNVLPRAFSGVAAILFLGGEFSVAILVIIGNSLLIVGFFLAIFLLLLFSIVLISALIRKIRTPCNCFGINTKQVASFDVWRNVGFILCALSGYGVLVWAKKPERSLDLLEWLFIGLGAVSFVVVWMHLAEIVQLFRHS